MKKYLLIIVIALTAIAMNLKAQSTSSNSGNKCSSMMKCSMMDSTSKCKDHCSMMSKGNMKCDKSNCTEMSKGKKSTCTKADMAKCDMTACKMDNMDCKKMKNCCKQN